MITFFSVPKPFEGHIGIIQENAIQSWKRVHPECEIILYGDEEGIKEMCDNYDVIHVPNIKRNEYGTPTLDFIFENAQEIANNQILCYVNADIILLNDIITTINRIPFERFLLVGNRRDVEITCHIDYEDHHWEKKLREYVIQNPQPLIGIDYFVFPKAMFGTIPSFTVGRAGWDNWMIYNSRKQKVPVINATQAIMAIHQNHSYSHVPHQKGTNYAGPESDNNYILSGGRRIYLWSLDDADWTATSSNLIHKKITLRECFRLLTLKSPQVFHPLFEAGFWTQHFIRYKDIK